MLDPERVAACVAAMRDAVAVPVTVKTRLGVDEHDSYEFLCALVARVTAAGCRTLIVHARKAWLKGLSPRENREIPPLDYERVYRLKNDFSAVEVVINGGFTTREAALAQLPRVDGVMLGRAAYQDPLLIADLDAQIFRHDARPLGSAIALYLRYVDRELAAGTPLRSMTRHLLGLRAGQAGGRRWRRELTQLPDGRAGFDALLALTAAHAPGGVLHAAA
jgi:tRNA-dihydrouridine synthase A